MKQTINFILAIIFLTNVVVFSANADGNEKNKNNQNVRVKGQVIDKNSGETLAGVQIKINGLNYTVTTDLDGNFSIPELQPGEYTLELTYISYKNETVSIMVGSDKEIVDLKVKLESR
ncbi:MAG: carboxypeptidase-like regulatory domain-containing protein [Sphingobacteriales bacterium]|nr:carboxypeptidase-like regulatory domain-containing protein [Sphingobacteriales bacterium]